MRATHDEGTQHAGDDAFVPHPLMAGAKVAPAGGTCSGGRFEKSGTPLASKCAVAHSMMPRIVSTAPPASATKPTAAATPAMTLVNFDRFNLVRSASSSHARSALAAPAPPRSTVRLCPVLPLTPGLWLGRRHSRVNGSSIARPGGWHIRTQSVGVPPRGKCRRPRRLPCEDS